MGLILFIVVSGASMVICGYPPVISSKLPKNSYTQKITVALGDCSLHYRHKS